MNIAPALLREEIHLGGKGGQLKKTVFILLAGFMIVPRAFSFTIISDSDLFYSFFEKPMTIIEFAYLKDGTTLNSVRNRNSTSNLIRFEPECLLFGRNDIQFAGNAGRISVIPNAFSDDWFFKATGNKEGESICEAIAWFNQGISSGERKMTVIAPPGKSSPFVIYTNKGFKGVVPDNSQETVFIFEDVSVVFSFETEFQKTPTTLNSKDTFVAGIIE